MLLKVPTIQLEETLKKQLENKATELKMNPDDLVVKDYLYLERVNNSAILCRATWNKAGLKGKRYPEGHFMKVVLV